MASVDSIPYPNIPTNNYDHKRCGGCEGSVDDGDGIVVSFGYVLIYYQVQRHLYRFSMPFFSLSFDKN